MRVFHHLFKKWVDRPGAEVNTVTPGPFSKARAGFNFKVHRSNEVLSLALSLRVSLSLCQCVERVVECLFTRSPSQAPYRTPQCHGCSSTFMNFEVGSLSLSLLLRLRLATGSVAAWLVPAAAGHPLQHMFPRTTSDATPPR